MSEPFIPFAWFLTDKDAEIAQWIGENLEESPYAISRKVDNRRSMIVYFASEMDEMLFRIRWT